MTLESDVAAITSRSIWVRARDRAEASGTGVPWLFDYDGAVVAQARVEGITPPTVTTATPPPLSSKSFQFGTATPYGVGATQMVGIIAAFASSSLSGRYPATVFRGSAEQNGWWANDGSISATIGARWATAFVSTGYTIWGRPDQTSQTPKDWTFQGSNDTTNGTDGTWTTLDTRAGQTAPSGVHYTFSNLNAYKAYRLNVSTSQAGSYIALSNFDIDGAPHRTNHSGSSGEFWIVRKAGAAACFGPNQTGTADPSFVPYTSTNIYWQIGSATRRDNIPTTVAWTSWHIERWVKDSTGVMALWVKPSGGTWTLVDSANTGAASWATNLFLGGNVNNAGSNDLQAELIHFNAALTASATTAPTSGDALKVDNYLTDKHFTAVSSGSPVSVSVPVLAGTGAVPAPTVSAGSSVNVATPALSGTGALVAPAVSAGTGARVDVPALAGTGALLAPDVVIAAGVTVAVPTLAGTGAVLEPTVLAGSAVTVDAPTLAGTGAVNTPTVTTEAPGQFRAPVLTDARLISGESQATIPDVEVWGAKVETDARMRLPLVLAAPPLGVLTEWPLQRQAHVMPALSASQPRMRPGIDYDIDYGVIGRPHVLVDGVDVTYLRGVPVRFADYTTSIPLWSASASLGLPQLKPWDELGTGDLAPFDMERDPAVEIAIARPDGSVEQVWEGYLASDEDNSGENREDYTFHAEGLFAQAMNEPYDPPVWMAPTDPGWIVADVLNSVTHRRWNKIPRADTGLPKVTDRGRPGQSKWQRVQDVLSKMLTTDGRQWTLMRVAPYTYRIQLKADTAAADWTVTKGAPGVECSFVTDQGTRRGAIFGRGFAPDGGYWEGRVFPGLEFGIPPRYPMDNTSLNLDGRSDGSTDTGDGITLWQRKMRELGYPVTVDGVMNPADVKWVRKIQRDAHLTVDGSLGPQTWAATWENNSTDVDLTTYRLPLVTKPGVEPFRYSASGARIGANPADDPELIRHAMPEIDFGSGIKKSDAIELAQIILDRESEPGIQGRVVLTTDPHEAGASRFDIKPGDNVHVVGHRGGTTFQVSEVSVSDLSVTLTVDTKTRDALAVEAILERNEEARRDPSSRTGRTLDSSSLNKSSVVQFESESKAGKVPRTAVNGDSGLWTGRKVFVSQVGIAKVDFTTSPNAELVVAVSSRPIPISVLASLAPDPLASSDGWYDNVDTLKEKYGLMEVFGSPGSPGGYWPRQKGDGPLTGRLQDSASSLYDSPCGGFMWVYMFTSRSTWVEGRVFPAVPT